MPATATQDTGEIDTAQMFGGCKTMRICGNDLAPWHICDGDIVTIKQRKPQCGDLVVIMRGKLPVVVKWGSCGEGTVLYCTADRGMSVKPRAEVRVVGVVGGVVRVM